MIRSFDNRVLAGVCGGIGNALSVNPNIIRMLFLILAGFNLTVALALYIALWWTMPQRSFIDTVRSGLLSTLFVLVFTILIIGGWIYSRTGGLVSTSGQDMYLPMVLLLLSLIFIVRQFRI